MATRGPKPSKFRAIVQPAERPWSAERLAATFNEGREARRPPVPPDLRKLHFHGSTAPKFERVEGGWTLSLPDDVGMGREARAGDPALTLERPGERVMTPPHRPPGSPTVYHPPLLGRQPNNLVRRRNGRRVQEHGVIFNNDDREIFNPGDEYPWRCAGRLLIWNKTNVLSWAQPDSTASAALVGPNFIVTSSHAVPKVTPYTAVFLPGLFGTKRSFDLWSWVQTHRQYSPYDKGSDIAIMKLYTPIGDTLGWFGSRTYSDDWEDMNVWTRIGYAAIPAKGSNGSFPNRALNFPIIDDDDSYGVELEYRSDASPGDSGGPVFSWWDDGPHIVGVHSGGEAEFDFGAWNSGFVALNNVASGGQALPDLVNWGHANW